VKFFYCLTRIQKMQNPKSILSDPVLAPTEDDIVKMLKAEVQIGTSSVTNQMKKYGFGRNEDGLHIINLEKTWEKLILAARILVAVENPENIWCIGARTYAQRAIIKFAHYTGTVAKAGRVTPGMFTNHQTRGFGEPEVLLVTDPRTDAQAIKEASFVNIPVIAFCTTSSPLEYVDVAIPCNNRSQNSIGLMYWLLAREVTRMQGNLQRNDPWHEVKVDLFIYRELEDGEAQEEKKEEIFEEPAIVYDPNEQWQNTQQQQQQQQGQNVEWTMEQGAENNYSGWDQEQQAQGQGQGQGQGQQFVNPQYDEYGQPIQSQQMQPQQNFNNQGFAEEDWADQSYQQNAQYGQQQQNYQQQNQQPQQQNYGQTYDQQNQGFQHNNQLEEW